MPTPGTEPLGHPLDDKEKIQRLLAFIQRERLTDKFKESLRKSGVYPVEFGHGLATTDSRG